MTTIVIASLILLYALWVIRTKVRDMKRGKFCNCGCDGCQTSCKKQDANSSEDRSVS